MRIGLALSGGGFRATLYHLGMVRWLRDADLLDVGDAYHFGLRRQRAGRPSRPELGSLLRRLPTSSTAQRGSSSILFSLTCGIEFCAAIRSRWPEDAARAPGSDETQTTATRTIAAGAALSAPPLR